MKIHLECINLRTLSCKYDDTMVAIIRLLQCPLRWMVKNFTIYKCFRKCSNIIQVKYSVNESLIARRTLRRRHG